MRSDKKSGADHISSLPCEVVGQILGRLPLCDAIRTSILSTEWRYKWTHLSELLLFDPNSNVNDKSLKSFLYQVMLVHQGHIRKFSLKVPNSNFCDHLILFLSKKNVQNLSLTFDKRKKLRLPSHLFKFQDLRHLELFGCKFHPPPSFRAFSKLVTLNFEDVSFEPASFQTLLSSSPLLEHLTLIWCNAFDSFYVDAPSLKFFEFCGLAKSLCFKNTPLLEEITLSLSSKSFTIALPEHQHNIKKLNFKVSYFGRGIAYAIYMISRCPNLERLRITSYSSKDPTKRVLKLLRAQKMPHSELKQLKRVDMEHMRGNDVELEILKYVLSSATTLENIRVATHPDISDHQKIKVEEIEHFPRASPNVGFTFIYNQANSNLQLSISSSTF